ncbi:hypothetical protein KI387_041434, partial [Taxus chinensis]
FVIDQLPHVQQTVACRPSDSNIYSRHNFVRLGFDTYTRRCSFVIGINKREIIPGGLLVVKIYDSKGDEWTTFHTINALSSAPTGEGVFSVGSFYW